MRTKGEFRIMLSHYLIKSLVKQRLSILFFAVLFTLSMPYSVRALENGGAQGLDFPSAQNFGNYNSAGLTDFVKSLWDIKIGGPNRFQGVPQINSSSPLILGDTLYAGSSTGIFYAYSLDKGKRLWSFDAGSAVYASVANDDSICFGTEAGKLYCLNRSSGEELFHYSITSSITSAPVMDSERIYLLSTNNRLHAITLTGGEKLWTYSQRNRVSLAPRFINTPAQSKEKLFALLSNGVLVAIEKDTGKELWQRTVLKGPGPWPGARKSPVYLKGNLYIIDKDGAILALDANNGSLRVVFDVAKAVDFVVTKDNIIIISTDELISVSRATGDALWIEALNAVSSNRIFGAGAHIYVVSVKEKDPLYLAYVMRKSSILSAYTIDDGTFLWKKKFRSSVSADIAVANKRLAILTDKGRLFVLGAKDE